MALFTFIVVVLVVAVVCAAWWSNDCNENPAAKAVAKAHRR